MDTAHEFVFWVIAMVYAVGGVVWILQAGGDQR